jgi:hypothetical protein
VPEGKPEPVTLITVMPGSPEVGEAAGESVTAVWAKESNGKNSAANVAKVVACGKYALLDLGMNQPSSQSVKFPHSKKSELPSVRNEMPIRSPARRRPQNPCLTKPGKQRIVNWRISSRGSYSKEELWVATLRQHEPGIDSGLEINREKTKVVKLKEEGGSLDFLGYTFRYYDDLRTRMAVAECVSVGEGAEAGTGKAARDDQPSAV